jgi:hypothetical protein
VIVTARTTASVSNGEMKEGEIMGFVFIYLWGLLVLVLDFYPSLRF